MDGSNIICPQISAKFAEADGPESAKKYHVFLSLTSTVALTGKIQEAHEASNHTEAYRLSRQKVSATESAELSTKGKPGELTADALASHSWYTLFAGQYAESLASADRSIALGKDNLVPQTNRVHALMMLGRIQDAKREYAAHKGETIGEKTWEKAIADDFMQLRKAGITHPLMDEIRGNALPPTELETLFPKLFAPKVAPPTAATESAPINLQAPEDPDVALVQQYKRGAMRGDVEAEFNLAEMHEAGRGGLTVSLEEAAFYYQQSADHGYAPAQVRMGALYELGKGVSKDPSRSAYYYRLAADQGNASGQSNLADAYEKGAGVPRNLCEAKRLRLLAVAQGEPHAQQNLAEMRGVARCKS